ncbi:hypothetical protein [Blastococcus sp. TBT05-19]|uniref:hypothetical protein n=1 Tax=Blastococcus sp. TBT05-19 TaxID=2250581 RepID=UPI0018F471BF|nr:hypothetical protein [Blastococcus sp. TBT05-19]
MTAGPGDQHDQQQGQQPQEGQQGGQPPAWPSPPAQPQPGQPPYGQPLYGQPPYGQQPPHGQQQPPYGQQNPHGQPPPYPPPNPYAFPAAPPAAAGWGGEVPKPMERPVTVRAGLGAYLAALVLGVVASIAMLVEFDEVLTWTQNQAGGAIEDPGLEGIDPAQFAELFLRVGLVVGLVVTALQLLFIWFAWRGHNWARVVLWVFAGLSLIAAPSGAINGGGPIPFVNALGWFQTVLLLVAVVLLALKPSNDWYRFRKWQRATGQG